MVGCCKLSLHANESCDEHAVFFGDDDAPCSLCTCSSAMMFLLANSGPSFSCIYTRVRTQSIQKQIVEYDIKSK